MIKHYYPADHESWTGRIDSREDYDAFRWHQWINYIDLNDDSLDKFEGVFGIVFIGYCCDEGVKLNKGRAGAVNGPRNIRRELMNLPCHFKEDLKLFDAGDIVGDECALPETQKALGQVVKRVLDLNLYPIVMGGGHDVAFGNYQGVINNLKERYEKPKLGIINFDAHFDLRPYIETGSSGTMFRQMADYCQREALSYDYFCIGIQQRGNTRSLFKSARDLGVKYVLAREISQEKMVDIFTSLDRFMKNKDAIYATICADVFSSAHAPGVSSLQPLGLQPWAVLTILKHILRSEKTISFDIAEVSPRFDRDNVTANLASTVIFHVVQQLAEIYEIDLDMY